MVSTYFQTELGGPTNILMVILTEREAYRVSALPDEAVIEEIMSVLRKIFGNNIPEATGVVLGRWSHDPLAYGCFTNRPYGFNDEMMDNIKKPLGRLYFAGGAYHSEHYGYAHGAYLSGEDQAEDVISCMHRNCKRKYH